MARKDSRIWIDKQGRDHGEFAEDVEDWWYTRVLEISANFAYLTFDSFSFRNRKELLWKNLRDGRRLSRLKSKLLSLSK
jgi:hypothetical protein